LPTHHSQCTDDERQVPGVSFHGVLYDPVQYPDVKDPSPVFDGARWHLFGTGCGVPHGCEILHSTAPRLDGRWQEEPPPTLRGVDHIAFRSAPGVVAQDGRLHMFLQHDFNILGGHIEHLVSEDGGRTFVRQGTALRSRGGTPEAGVYDPDAAEIDGRRYLVYAAMGVVGQPELYLARARKNSWDSPWKRLGCILDHVSVSCHNQIGGTDYEWGLEGPQLLQLPDNVGTLFDSRVLSSGPASRPAPATAAGRRPEGYRPLPRAGPPGAAVGARGKWRKWSWDSRARRGPDPFDLPGEVGRACAVEVYACDDRTAGGRRRSRGDGCAWIRGRCGVARRWVVRSEAGA
jgi:hypothetical protein